MYRVALALLLLFSLRPAPAAAGSAVGKAGRWMAAVEEAGYAVIGANVAERRAWTNEEIPGGAPPAALPPPRAALARAHAAVLPTSPAPSASPPCGPQSLSYYATAPPLS